MSGQHNTTQNKPFLLKYAVCGNQEVDVRHLLETYTKTTIIEVSEIGAGYGSKLLSRQGKLLDLRIWCNIDSIGSVRNAFFIDPIAVFFVFDPMKPITVLELHEWINRFGEIILRKLSLVSLVAINNETGNFTDHKKTQEMIQEICTVLKLEDSQVQYTEMDQSSPSSIEQVFQQANDYILNSYL